MQNKKLVSVIVPIYRVETYLRRCIDSIINQTYQHLEIILVNDGSPDACPDIAVQYQTKDWRVDVLHKENGGLSDARNYGMTYASGDYMMFVDSDDWLETHMIEHMVHNMFTYQADIVQSAFYYAYDDQLYVDNRFQHVTDPPLLMDHQAMMEALINNNLVKNFAWGKLYKTELIKDIPFKKGVLFEDVFWAHHVMSRAQRLLVLSQPYYYYYQREDSIVANYSTRSLDMLEGLKKRHEFIESFYPDLIAASYRHILKMHFVHYNLLLQNKQQDPSGKYRRQIESFVQHHHAALKQAVQSNRQLRRQLYLFSMNPYLNIGFLGLQKGLRKLRLLKSPAGLSLVTGEQPKKEHVQS